MEKSIQNQLKVNDVTFWMMMDGKRIDFEVYDCSGFENLRWKVENHPVKHEYVIRPNISDTTKFKSLELRTDRVVGDFEYVKEADSEFCDGGVFNVGQTMFGLAIYDLFHWSESFPYNKPPRISKSAKVNVEKFRAEYSDITLHNNNWLYFQISTESKTNYDQQVASRGFDVALKQSFEVMRDVHDDIREQASVHLDDMTFSNSEKSGKDIHIGPIKFWMERDGKKIDSDLIDVTKETQWLLNQDKIYSYPLNIKRAWLFKPILPYKYAFDELKLCSHYDHKEILFDTCESDEYFQSAYFDAAQFKLGFGVQQIDDTMMTFSKYSNTYREHVYVDKNMEAGYDSMNQDNREDLLFLFVVKEKEPFPYCDPEYLTKPHEDFDSLFTAMDIMFPFSHREFWDYPKS